MSLIHLWTSLIGGLLCAGFSTQNKTPDVHVTCIVSKSCILPCSFPPAQLQHIQWFKQDSLVVSYKPDQPSAALDNDPLSGRAAIFVSLVTNGNASLVVKDSSPKDRGKFRCSVKTSEKELNVNVIVKVEAPIRELSVELSRLSGYEEMKCTVQHVFPPPKITWSTEPPTFQDLRPVTRKHPDSSGLYMVDSRLRTLSGQPDLIYICKATSSYGGPAWTASHRQREIRGYEGKDVTIPCRSPSYLNSQTLEWNFYNSDKPKHILTYSVQSGRSMSSSEWNEHVELDGYRVQFGDGSLRLMDPDEEDHSGSYTCVFSTKFNMHTERADVTISGPGKRSAPEEKSYWWVMGLIVAILVVALVAMLVYLKMRGFVGGATKVKSDPEEATELHPVKDSDNPLSSGGTNGQSASALT